MIGLGLSLFLLSSCKGNLNSNKERVSETLSTQQAKNNGSELDKKKKKESNEENKVSYPSGELIKEAEAGNLSKVKLILIDKNYNIDEVNGLGESALLVATHNNYVEIAKVLINAGASVNLQDQIHDSPYLYAAAQGKTEILKYILEHAHPNQEIYNRFGGNAIIPAAEKGHLDNVRLLLLDGKADINHQNNYGYTALIEAVALRDGSELYQEIVRVLLEGGADRSLRDRTGRSAEDYARELGYKNILDILRV